MAAAEQPDQLQASYRLLHEAILGATPAAVEAFENQLADLRELARKARTLLRAIEQSEDALFAAIADLRDAPTDGPLRGIRLTRAAEQALRDSVEGEMHYRDVHQALRDSGQRIGGKDSVATLLTALSRSPHVKTVGNRTGIYRIKEPAT